VVVAEEGGEKLFKRLLVYSNNRGGRGGDGVCENRIRNISKKLTMEAYLIWSQVEGKNEEETGGGCINIHFHLTAVVSLYPFP
jgi:hypothetical protein